MSEPAAAQPVETEILAGILGEILSREGHTAAPLSRLERSLSPLSSSFPLEELTVTFQDGRQLQLIFKNVSPRALPAAVRATRPSFLDDPLREIDVYRALREETLGTPAFYGCHVDAANDRFWLFLEKVEGRPLSLVGDFDVWRTAARRLALLHQRLSSRNVTRGLQSRLIRHDRPLYECWIQRALQFAAGESGPGALTLERLHRIAEIHPLIVDELLMQPPVVIHGEFYASNVLIEDGINGIRVCPIDWERAAVGPALIDLAALTGGNWSEEQKRDMVEEYRIEQQRLGVSLGPARDHLRQFELCRIQLAVQWLGWSRDWRPPREHQQDWIAEAIGAARRCGYQIE